MLLAAVDEVERHHDREHHAEDREDEQGDAGQGDQRRRLVLERLRHLERMLDRMDDLLRLLLQMSYGYGLPV